MFEKIKSYLKHPFVQQFHDVRAWGLLLFAVVAVLVSWSGVKAIQTNYDLQKQISALQQQNDVSQLENENLDLQNKYLDTNQYLELAARQSFGKAAPGETELLVPKNVALAHTIDLPSAKDSSTSPSLKRPKYQQNFEAWIDFFLHRQNTST